MPAAPAFRVTERDRELLVWASRWALVTQGQLSTRFSMARPTVFTRGRVLREAGLVDYQRPIDELPGVYGATAAGMAMAGLDAAPGRPPAWALWSHMAIVDAVAELERDGGKATPGVQLLRDRERLAELPALAGGRPFVPDAIAEIGERRVAICALERPVGAGPGRVAIATLEALAGLQARAGWELRLLIARSLVEVVGELPDEVTVEVLQEDEPGRHRGP